MMGKNKKIPKVRYDDFIDLAEQIFEDAIYEEQDVGFIGDFDATSELLRALINVDGEDDLTIMDITLECTALSGYDGPYLFEVASNGDIWCQKAIVEEKDIIYSYESDIMYVQPSYMKKAIDASCNDDCEFYEIHIGEETEPEITEDLGGSRACLKWDDDLFGFTFCTCSDDGEEEKKFRYRGNKKLEEKEVYKIINDYTGCFIAAD